MIYRWYTVQEKKKIDYVYSKRRKIDRMGKVKKKKKRKQTNK